MINDYSNLETLTDKELDTIQKEMLSMHSMSPIYVDDCLMTSCEVYQTIGIIKNHRQLKQ